MMGIMGGSIFRSSFLLALSGAFLLALASISVILTTSVPFDFPVSALDVARALKGERFAQQGAPLSVIRTPTPAFHMNGDDQTARVLAASIAQQANVPATSVIISFDELGNSFPQRQLDVARRKYEESLLNAAEIYRGDERFSPLIFGPFKAALRRADGSWSVVTRRPVEPQWQYNVAKGILISLLLMVPLAWWSSRRLAAPIRALGNSANRIGSGSYEDVKVEGPREVRQAAIAMNQMQARIQMQINERAEMLAAIAHDLRTPLSRLSFLLAEQPLSNRSKVEEELAEMDQMISTTMDYVRSELVEPVHEKIDLLLLLESIVDDFRDRGHPAMLHSGPPLTLPADPAMLRRVLVNVIGNGLVHGGRVLISAHSSDNYAHIEVRDDGPGMADNDIARAFDPFFRAEQSRSRETGGTGLGLAIAKRGVDAHGGKIALKNLPEGGLLVTIDLPVKPFK